MEPKQRFSEEYRGPSGWWSATKAAVAWFVPGVFAAGGIAGVAGFKDIGNHNTSSENLARFKEGMKANKLAGAGILGVLVGIPVIAAVRSYFTATTAQADHEAAVATVKDLMVENAKLKADYAYQSRFAEREQARRGEAAEHTSIVGR